MCKYKYGETATDREKADLLDGLKTQLDERAPVLSEEHLAWRNEDKLTVHPPTAHWVPWQECCRMELHEDCIELQPQDPAGTKSLVSTFLDFENVVSLKAPHTKDSAFSFHIQCTHLQFQWDADLLRACLGTVHQFSPGTAVPPKTKVLNEQIVLQG